VSGYSGYLYRWHEMTAAKRGWPAIWRCRNWWRTGPTGRICWPQGRADLGVDGPGTHRWKRLWSAAPGHARALMCYEIQVLTDWCSTADLRADKLAKLRRSRRICLEFWFASGFIRYRVLFTRNNVTETAWKSQKHLPETVLSAR